MLNERLKEIMEENGILYDGNRIIDSASINSITFVSAIVDIEEEFKIFIPDEYITMKLIYDLENLERLVQDLIKTSDGDVN